MVVAGYPSDAAPARVLRADRGVCTVLDDTGVTRASLGGGVLLEAARDPAGLPTAGDWVVLRRWPDRRVTVECVLPRRTVLIGRTSEEDATGQVLAANMDTVAVVEPVHPEPDPARIERLLAMARESGASPVIVLTRTDTSADPAAVARQLALLAPGVPVIGVSVPHGTGVEAVRAYTADGRTLALLGRSGTGKSALVHALSGTPVMPVPQIRNLVLLPSGGAVIDTPGLRGIGLLDAAGGLAARPTGTAGHRRPRT